MSAASTIPAVLQRHYSTIGIEDVFLEGPPHSLPSVYLRQQGIAPPFTSWEIVGTIKSVPEDFCVREILTGRRKIPGLSHEDHEKLRIADVLASNELPKQQLNVTMLENQGEMEVRQKKVEECTPNVPTKLSTAESEAIILLYLENALSCMQSFDATAESLLADLKGLDETAKKFLEGSLALVGSVSVLLPPLLGHDLEPSVSDRSARRDLHRALKVLFPLLYAKSVTKDDLPHWIEITIDDSYRELIPCLLDPVTDIPSLLSFQKEGLADDTSQSDQPEVVLRLTPNATKEERKSVHHTLAKRSKLFNTSTITDYQLDDGATTTAICVKWDTRSVSRKRKRPNDSAPGRSTSLYPNTLVVLHKRQKEHLTALQKIMRTLHCRESDLGIAGIKDMHAVTYQFCTLRNTRAEHVAKANRQLEQFNIKLSHFYQVDWVLNNGDLDGNEFTLVIRDLKRVQVADDGNESLTTCEGWHLHDMVDRVRRSGFINFYGEQRVGSAGSTSDVGVRAFDIGRAMLQQDFAKAVDLMMTGRHGDDSRESDAAKRVRQTWKDTEGDPQATLKAFHGADNIMTREKIVLKGLNRFGKDKPLDAIRCLSYSVRSFWINAYQSFVWNQAASLRMRLYGMKVAEGDLYEDLNTSEVKVVRADDVAIQIYQVVLPLPGHSIRYPENEVGTLYQALLAKDSVMFASSAPPESVAKGTYRRLAIKPAKLESEIIVGEEAAARLTFQLPKGCYATMFLRELMLSTCRRTGGNVVGHEHTPE